MTFATGRLLSFGFSIALIGAALAPPPARAESLFEKRFEWSAPAGVRVEAAVTVKGTVVVQLGREFLIGMNEEAKAERWRFTSKAKAIRSLSLRTAGLLVEAEQLHMLDPVTGDERWEVPLNCFPERCNSKVRLATDQFVLLTGFDGKEDNVMLIDAQSGQQLWPNWVPVAAVQHVVISPTAIILATGAAPFHVVALDRFTSRERWRLRPEGIEGPAAGLASDGTVLNAWWRSGSADVVHAAEIDTGKSVAEWTVARRKGADTDLRGTAPGVFVAYQSSVLGGGTLRGYDNRSAETTWRVSLAAAQGAPTLIGDRVLVRDATGQNSTGISAVSASTGKVLWTYRRDDARTLDWRLEGGRAVVIAQGKTNFIGLLDLIGGRMEGIAPLDGAAPERISYTTGQLYLYSGNEVRRFDPTADALVLERFESAMKRGEVAEAKTIAKSLKPFTGELEVAAKINSAVGGQPFQAASQRLESGGLPTVLAALDRASTDDKMTFYEDFKVFIELARNELSRAGVGATDGDDRTRLATMALRVTDLSVRFERQLAGKAGEDKPVIAAIGAVASSLAESLLASGRPDDAYAALRTLWAKGWVPHTAPLLPVMRTAVAHRLRKLMPALETSVASGDGADMALAEIADLIGIEALVDPPPSVDAIPDMAPGDYAAMAERLKNVLKTVTPK